MQDIAGKTAVITGAASGIGRAMAERFADAGMQLVLADIEMEPLTAFAAELEDAGTRTVAVRADVSDLDQVQSLAETATDRFGSVHLLCNNAGVGAGGATSWDLTDDDWSWCLGVNLWGVIHGIRAFVPAMIAHGEPAHVVNTASMAGHIAGPFMGPYNVSKYGVVALSETMHAELQMTGSSVGVSVLCPGFVKTQIMASERNRPADLDDTAPSVGDQETRDQMGQAIMANATPPAEIGHAVHDAVTADRFWILTHEDMMPLIDARYESISSGENPGSLGFIG
jgi:NAD(P)-dependent dehydrogenase (short-subunit alcohol dehydrogenase family)